jgi:hypothetical protein
MTAAIIKKQEIELNNELAKLAAKFPSWNLFYEFNDSVTDLTTTIKSVIKEMKLKFPNYKFSVCRNSYNSLLLLNITPVDKDEEFAYYGGNNCGYIVCNDMYKTITDEFKNHDDISLFGIRVFEYIENARTMQLEFKENY